MAILEQDFFGPVPLLSSTHVLVLFGQFVRLMQQLTSLHLVLHHRNLLQQLLENRPHHVLLPASCNIFHLEVLLMLFPVQWDLRISPPVRQIRLKLRLGYGHHGNSGKPQFGLRQLNRGKNRATIAAFHEVKLHSGTRSFLLFILCLFTAAFCCGVKLLIVQGYFAMLILLWMHLDLSPQWNWE